MSYTKDELYKKLLATYSEQGLAGELVELVSGILSEYLYLHQMEDVSILMEDSFLRSKLLNSRIQHAADNFYSVFRGRNRCIQIDNLGCLNDVNVKKYDTVSSYGQYKLVYADDYFFNERDKAFSFQGLLSIDAAQTVTFRGNGKYFYDIIDSNGDLVKDISEDLIVTSIDDRGTAEDIADDVTHTFIVSENLVDLYTKNENRTAENLSIYKAEICAMTLPNYGVRLWKRDGFLESCTYTVKYLKSPDATKPEINIEKDIRVIPGYTKNAGNRTTHITEISPQGFKLDDIDKIYMEASSSKRFDNTMKSINSIDNEITSQFPQIKGFKTVIGPSNNPIVSVGDISVYVTSDSGDQKFTTEQLKKMSTDFRNVLRSWQIKDKIDFINATPVQLNSNESPLHVDITYNDNIDFAVCDAIVKNKLYVVGENFNPYQIIADLMSNELLMSKITLVEVYMKDGNTRVYPSVIQLDKNQHISYNYEISYISNRM